MKTLSSNNIESKKATRRGGSKNTAEVEALRKLATAMIGRTFEWANGRQYRLESFEKVTKNKVTFWLSEPPRHHDIYTMDFSRSMLEHLQATGEHRTDYGTTIREVSEAEKPLAYIIYCRGVAQDIFKDWGEAVADLSRHVYGTLQDCCGGKVSKESESRYQVYFKEGDKWEVCEVLPIDLNRPKDREAYKAQRERLGLPTLQPASEITANDVLQVGTMVRMPGIIGGLRVEEIDRKGNRVTCIDGSNEKHTYNSLEYFTATAEEISIPEWLRICQYFYIGPKGVKNNRVLCIDIILCSDQEKPVIIVYSDHEGNERKIFLSPGLDELNQTDRERLTAKYREQIVNNMQLGCGCMVGDGDEGRKDSKWVKVRKAYTNDSLSPRDWTYCVCWYDVEPIDQGGYRETLRECENGVTLEQAARAMAQFEEENKPFFIAGKKYRCIRDVKMKKGGETAFKAGSTYEQSCEPSRWCGWLDNEQGERHGWPQPVYIEHECQTWDTKPEDIDPRNYFEAVA